MSIPMWTGLRPTATAPPPATLAPGASGAPAQTLAWPPCRRARSSDTIGLGGRQGAFKERPASTCVVQLTAGEFMLIPLVARGEAEMRHSPIF